MKRLAYFLALALASGNFSPAVLAAAAPGDTPARPTIGLVLGGGGARGAAHIGVLKELERMRIPVDAIAGTSMGAIVGGLYASGMTASELEDLIGTLDWNNAFKDSANRKNKRYRRKQDDADFPMSLELGYRDRSLLLPSGVVQGQNLGTILRELTLGVSGIDDFDKLPIPYRAVASDIVTGEAVVLGRGDLALAIRASMSAPGIFAPVSVGEHTLVDGGLVGNVPVSTMKDMGVDIVIAVDVEFPLYEPDDLASALSISAQMLTILIRKETLREIALLDEDDMLIRPELGDFGSSNFAEITEAVEPGVVAARAMRGQLSRYSLSAEDFAVHVAARQPPAVPETLDFVRVRDDGHLSPRVLMSRIKTQPGDEVDPEALASDASRLYGLQLYQHVDYRLVSDESGTGVEFVSSDKSWGPNFLKFGVSLQDDLEGNTAFNVASRMTRSAVNGLGAEWRLDLQVGTEPYAFTEFYQPLSFDSRYFVAPNLTLERRLFNVFEADDNLARYRVAEGKAGLDVGRELGLWGELRLGVFRGTGSARVNVGSPDLPNSSFHTGGLFASFNIDTQDDAQIPLSGVRANVSWTSSLDEFGADEVYDTLDAYIESAWTRGRHTLNAALAYGTSEDADDIVRNYFTLGGFLTLSGLQPGEVSGAHAAFGRLVYYRRSGNIRGSFDVPLYLGGSIEIGNAWQSRSDISFDSALVNGSLFIAADTIIGPVFLAAGFGEGGNKSLYLSFGQTPRQ